MAHNNDHDNRSGASSSRSSNNTNRSSGNQGNTPDRNSDGTFRSDDDR
ncbi:MAG TPA: hypothetical protein VG934_02650 [Candidatus Paceibacterota bacterium]|nr:hypothetical protein [Candidatus Paceibacterota bacterium]